MARTTATARKVARFHAPKNARRMAEHMAAILMQSLSYSAWVESPTYEDVEQRQLYWRWVLGLLFSGDASHRICRVSFLANPVLPEDVLAAPTVFDADDPVKHLFASSELIPSDVNQEDTPKWVSAKRFYLDRPDLRTSRRLKKRNRIERKPQPLKVRVVGSVTSFSGAVFWVVLYPVQGIAWVKPRDAKILDTSDSAEMQPQSSPHVFISGLSETSKESNLALVKMIGDRLEVLDADGNGDVDGWCRELFVVCPNLRGLTLSEDLRICDLRTIMDSSVAGHCQLRSLEANHLYDVESTNVLEFFEALSNPRHPLTKRLLDLCISFEISSKVSAAFEAAVRRMLRLNRRLQTMDFFMSGPGSSKIEIIVEETAVREAPLAMSSKVIFIKAISLALLTGSALGQLDSGVLASIFEFAAPHRMREFRCLFV